MRTAIRSLWLTIAGWVLGIVALLPIALIAGSILVAPVDWHTRLIIIPIMVGICVLLMIGSFWCFRLRDDHMDKREHGLE